MAKPLLPMVLAAISNTDQPLWRYCLIVTPIAIVPAFALGVSTDVLISLAGANSEFLAHRTFRFEVLQTLDIVLLGPLVETLLLAGGLRILSALSDRALFVKATSALLWAAAHAILAPIGFFAIAWAFFVFSSAYLAWRSKSFRSAFVAAAVPHILYNAVNFGLLLAGFD